jgi:hypothetical protein
LSLRDAWQEIKPTDPGFSFDPVANPNAARSKGDPQMQIDLVLFKESSSLKLKPESIDLIHTENLPYGKPLSDHYGVKVQFDTEAMNPVLHE